MGMRTKVKQGMRCVILAGVIMSAVASTLLPEVGRAALPLRTEAETYVASYNAGGSAIGISSCSVASGGLVASGVDAGGDWVECRLTMPAADSFRVAVHSGGDIGVIRNWLVEFYTEQEPRTLLFGDTLVTVPGGGLG